MDQPEAIARRPGVRWLTDPILIAAWCSLWLRVGPVIGETINAASHSGNLMFVAFSKSDFLHWRECPKSFWLELKRPQEFRRPPPSEFARMLMADGFVVEREVKRLIDNWPDVDAISFQQEFASDDGLHARADVVRTRADDSLDIFEVKSSTSTRGSDGRDHVVDACFQTIVAERAGYTVNSCSIIHVNKAFVRGGDIDPSQLLSVVDVTDKVAGMRADLEEEIDNARAMLSSEEIDETNCECRYSSRAKWCAAFHHLNPDIPDLPAHFLPRVSKQKLKKLDDDGRLAIEDVTEADVTATQLPVWKALVTGEAQIDRGEVEGFMDGLEWPLWFYDYETVASAVPTSPGHQPHISIPVQFSVHRLDEDGTLEHFEFLSEQPGQEDELIAALKNVIGSSGTLLAWNMSTEKSLNERLAKLRPASKDFLLDLNARTVDLMEIFKRGWVEPRFEGSTSIKKVLPVMVPELSYADEDVHDGTGAILAWREMVETDNQERRDDLKRQLLAYCKLDTLAMVEIFRRIRKYLGS